MIANHFPLPVPLMLNSKAIKGHMTIAITTIGPNFPKEMFAWISIKKSSERAKKILGDILRAKSKPPFLNN